MYTYTFIHIRAYFRTQLGRSEEPPASEEPSEESKPYFSATAATTHMNGSAPAATTHMNGSTTAATTRVNGSSVVKTRKKNTATKSNLADNAVFGANGSDAAKELAGDLAGWEQEQVCTSMLAKMMIVFECVCVSMKAEGTMNMYLSARF